MNAYDYSFLSLISGLAKNPLKEGGVLGIGAGFTGTRNVNRLDFSKCDVGGPNGAYRVAQIIGFHKTLEEMDMSNLPLGEIGGNKLLEVLEENLSVQQLDVRGCGLTEVQELNVRILVKRNQYYKQNPCLLKDYITEEDSERIDQWMNRVK